MKKLILGTSLCVLGALCPEATVFAEEDEPRWFEIEVIVFKSTNQNGLFAESWDTDYQVEFPENLVDFLQPTAQLIDEHDLLTQIGEYLINEDPKAQLVNEPVASEDASALDHSSNDPLAQLDDAQLNNQPGLSQADTLAGTTSPGVFAQGRFAETPSAEITQNPGGSDSSQMIEEKPFELLDKSLLQLTNEARTLNRHPEYRVVVHYAWRQPVLGNRDAPHIRIAGGKDFSEEYEFNGAKKLLAEQSYDDVPELIFDEDGNIIGAQQPGYDSSQSDTLGDAQFATNESTTEPAQANSSGAASSQQATQLDDPTNNSSTEAKNKDVFESGNLLMQAQALEGTPLALPWVPEVDGDIKVYLSRFLHIKTNLYLRMPDKEEVDMTEIQLASNPLTGGIISGETPQSGLSILGVSDNNDLIPANQNSSVDNNDVNPLMSGLEIPTISAADTNSPSTMSAATSNVNGSAITDSGSSINNFLLSNNQFVNASGQSLSQSQFSWEIDDNFLETETEKMYIERLFNYPLKQSRRVRSGELHFFDHPMMGVIIMIRPYEKDQELTEQEGLMPLSM
ncbi:hypothetical protein FLL45_04245 [Aliikangiella marina]|uniref:Peptidoglycan-binding protein CsiV n=1 Tax=Aliikangiella marina TaxID=1712262 RepID=A0A545TIW7_9GAMM|nr:CsiV family protein [Aliikangiella marina]TQV77165.1 hypothetical protein FLL45_04245 [Aliikangiella marina]